VRVRSGERIERHLAKWKEKKRDISLAGEVVWNRSSKATGRIAVIEARRLWVPKTLSAARALVDLGDRGRVRRIPAGATHAYPHSDVAPQGYLTFRGHL